MRPGKVFSLQLALAVVLCGAAFAGSKEDAARDLTKSLQQMNLWAEDPVKVVATVVWRHGAAQTIDNVTMPRPKQDLHFTYELPWAGGFAWRGGLQ